MNRVVLITRTLQFYAPTVLRSYCALVLAQATLILFVLCLFFSSAKCQFIHIISVFVCINFVSTFCEVCFSFAANIAIAYCICDCLFRSLVV